MKAIRRVVPVCLALVAGLGILVTGCGGSDDDSGDGALTREELSAAATDVCLPAGDAINEAVGKMFAGPKPGPQEFAEVSTTTVIPQLTEQTDGLAELQPPNDLEDAYASYLDSAEQVLVDLKADPAAPFTGDPAEFYADSNEKGRAAGLPDVCLAGPG